MASFRQIWKIQELPVSALLGLGKVYLFRHGFLCPYKSPHFVILMIVQIPQNQNGGKKKKNQLGIKFHISRIFKLQIQDFV